MSGRILHAQPLNREAFAPFGEVIEAVSRADGTMNDGRFEKFTALAQVDMNRDGQAKIDIVRSMAATTLPYEFQMLERHPLGSQAFIPLADFVFCVVVAPRGNAPDPDAVQAFVSNGRQGINYHRGTWHMPLIALAGGQRFLVIDRSGDAPNCDQVRLDAPLTLAPVSAHR